MCDVLKKEETSYSSPQCQYFVIRKKRLCRMTVKPGKHYCGEHEPQPKTGDGQDDTRIPCPNDSKHTCYASKLEKHLSICNARPLTQPDYIIPNVNAPATMDDCPRLPLAKTPLRRIVQVIDKVNTLYDTYVKDKIITLPELPIHNTVLQEFNEAGRAESSLRHLRQVSSLLHAVEAEELVADNTAYVELGAGKGQLSYYAWWAWCRRSGSRVVLVDRASLRHKRDNKLAEARPNKHKNTNNHLPSDSDTRSHDDSDEDTSVGDKCDSVHRIRADLAHLSLERVPAVRACDRVVGFAKHLCGVATDLALRCVTAGGVRHKLRGAVLAPCCHHRCERAAYPAAALLQELGIDADDFNILLGIVSWATCGDGRSRDRRNRERSGARDNPDLNNTEPHDTDNCEMECNDDSNPGKDRANSIQNTRKSCEGDDPKAINSRGTVCDLAESKNKLGTKCLQLSVGEDDLGTKCLQPSVGEDDLGTKCLQPSVGEDELGTKCLQPSVGEDELGTKCLQLSVGEDELGTKCLQPSVGEDELGTKCLQPSVGEDELGTRCLQLSVGEDELGTKCLQRSVGEDELGTKCLQLSVGEDELGTKCLQRSVGEDELGTKCLQLSVGEDELGTKCLQRSVGEDELGTKCLQLSVGEDELGTRCLQLSVEQRAEVGRRAKALLDWGRVRFLAEHGFRARLVRYVPDTVSPENVCILATKHVL